MRRRGLLRAGAGMVALPMAGRAARGSPRSGDDYAPLGTVGIEGAAEAVVDETGETVFMAASTGFATVDVGDPSDPTVLVERRDVLGDRDGGPLEDILDVKYDDGTLVVAGPAGSGGFTAFALFDVSDPASPDRLGYRETPSSIHNCYLADDTVYITGNEEPNSPVIAYDVSDPTSIDEVGRWSPVDADEQWAEFPTTNIHDIYVHDGVAYCAYWDMGTFLVDVVDPSAPTLLSRIGDYAKETLLEWSESRAQEDFLTLQGNAHYVAVDEDASLLAVGAESWETDPDDDAGGPSGIDLYDVSDPESPETLARIRAPKSGDNTYSSGTWTTSHNFDIADGRLYSSWYQGGVKIFDVSDPTAPEQLAWWRTPSAAFWTAQKAPGRDLFVASTHDVPSDDDTEGLFVFPDRVGTQQSPPKGITNPDPLVVRPPFETDRTTGTPVETGTDSGSGSGDDSGTDTGAPRDGSTPGFGALAALGGLGVGVWRILRDDEAR